MCPNTSDEGYGEDDTLDTGRAMVVVTDPERANLITDMVAHPKGSPSLQELEHLNPSLERAVIQVHLSVLQEVNVVEQFKASAENRMQDFPHTFYSITAAARRLFNQHGVFPEELWKRQYRRIQKPDEIEIIEELPRQ